MPLSAEHDCKGRIRLPAQGPDPICGSIISLGLFQDMMRPRNHHAQAPHLSKPAVAAVPSSTQRPARAISRLGSLTKLFYDELDSDAQDRVLLAMKC